MREDVVVRQAEVENINYDFRKVGLPNTLLLASIRCILDHFEGLRKESITILLIVHFSASEESMEQRKVLSAVIGAIVRYFVS